MWGTNIARFLYVFRALFILNGFDNEICIYKGVEYFLQGKIGTGYVSLRSYKELFCLQQDRFVCFKKVAARAKEACYKLYLSDPQRVALGLL